MALQEAPDSIEFTVNILLKLFFLEDLGYVYWELFIICAHSISSYF